MNSRPHTKILLIVAILVTGFSFAMAASLENEKPTTQTELPSTETAQDLVKHEPDGNLQRDPAAAPESEFKKPDLQISHYNENL